MLHEPTLRIKRSAEDEDAYVYVHALRELFGLDPETAPAEERDASVTPLRRQGRKPS
jgi:hypothetical protein